MRFSVIDVSLFTVCIFATLVGVVFTFSNEPKSLPNNSLGYQFLDAAEVTQGWYRGCLCIVTESDNNFIRCRVSYDKTWKTDGALSVLSDDLKVTIPFNDSDLRKINEDEFPDIFGR